MAPFTNALNVRLFIVGVVGGLFSGFFGVGGGIVMVPLLMWLAGREQREAHALSLLAIVGSGIVATSSYAVGGVFPIAPGIALMIGAVLAAPLGSYLLRRIPLALLRWGFIAFILTMALLVLVTIPDRGISTSMNVETILTLALIGIAMGTLAGLFGIGGGIIAIPLMMVILGIGDLEAKAISLIAMVPTAISGSVANLRSRTTRLALGIPIALGALATAPIGSLAAFALPESAANVVFGCFAIIAALALVVRTRRTP